jgi:hypothetical protein
MKLKTQLIYKFKNIFVKYFLFLRFSMNLYEFCCQDYINT